MFFQKLLCASLGTGFIIGVVACSGPDNESSKSKLPAQIACEHMNDLCSGTQGYRTQDCSNIEAEYAALSATDKAEADALVPCILAAKTCQPAVQCLQPSSAGSKSGQGSDTKASEKTNTTEDACEHINDLCADTDGFKAQDCSHSLEDYAKLSSNDQQLADQIVPCVMDAEACSTAFDCLDVQQ